MHTLMIVDDEELSRFSLRTMIARSFSDISVVCEAETGLEAVERYAEFRPDGVIMDIRIPELSGLEASRRILSEFPKANILICSAYDSFSLVSEALDIGVKGYLLKPPRREELVEKLSRLFHTAPSPVEALAEQRMLTLMVSGQLSGGLREDLNRYYGSIERGLLLAFAPEGEPQPAFLALKKHAPRLGYAITGMVGELGAAFLSPIDEPAAWEHKIAKLLQPLKPAFRMVESGDWPRGWAELSKSIAAPKKRALTLDEAIALLSDEEQLRALSLESLAQKLGISPQHLSASFKELKGVNFLEFVTERRMALAAKLLRETALPVSEIAGRCGYSDASYFKKLFARGYGLSPHEFRVRGERRG